MEAGKYCSAVFLDVSQASDKVWYRGLLYKIKNRFLTDLYIIIRSYLLHKTFRVKCGEMITQLKGINSGDSQGSILGPVLYLLYSVDLPVALGSTTATYTDYTVVLVVHNNHIEVSLRLQKCLYHIQRWFKKWKIKANGTKSVQVHYPKKDMSTSNIMWSENPSSRRCQIFRAIAGSQAKLKKTCMYQA